MERCPVPALNLVTFGAPHQGRQFSIVIYVNVIIEILNVIIIIISVVNVIIVILIILIFIFIFIIITIIIIMLMLELSPPGSVRCAGLSPGGV